MNEIELTHYLATNRCPKLSDISKFLDGDLKLSEIILDIHEISIYFLEHTFHRYGSKLSWRVNLFKALKGHQYELICNDEPVLVFKFSLDTLDNCYQCDFPQVPQLDETILSSTTYDIFERYLSRRLPLKGFMLEIRSILNG